jgi:hypothetical protein
MTDIRTPDDILTEIRGVRTTLLKGSDALRDTELAAERAELAADLAADKAFMVTEGSIPVREIAGREHSQTERDAAFVARAEFNRVKAKMRHYEAALVSLQAELKWARESGA